MKRSASIFFQVCTKRFLHVQTSFSLSDAPASNHHPNQLFQIRNPPRRRLTSTEGRHSHFGLTGVANPAHTRSTTRVAHSRPLRGAPLSLCRDSRAAEVQEAAQQGCSICCSAFLNGATPPGSRLTVSSSRQR